jgi:hypothetical protein
MRLKSVAIAALSSGLAASAASGSIPKGYLADLPRERQAGEVRYRTGGSGDRQAQAIKRAASEYPLELVFVERDGKREIPIADMPVRITDAEGRVVFDGQSEGPYFLARLPEGRYTVSTRWDAWSFSRPVRIGGERQRVVFAWSKPGADWSEMVDAKKKL